MGALKLDASTVLKKLDDIPSLPAIVYELSRIINNPMSSTKEVEDIMAQDIGMTTKVLKLANSAYYAIPGGVSNLGRAVSFIGFDAIHQLVLSASIIKALEVKGPSQFNINEFWKHSVGTAIAAEIIAKHIKHKSPSDLFTCGLIHDIGKMALYIASSETLLFIAGEAEKNKKTFTDIEIQSQLPQHTELGKLLGEKWRLPKSFIAVSKYHHEKDLQKRGGLSRDLNQVVDIVMLANLLIHALKFGNSGHHVVLGAPNELIERLMLNTKSDVPVILKSIKSSLVAAEDFIKTIGSVT